MTHIVGVRMKNFACYRGEFTVAPLEAKAYAIVAQAEGDEARSNWLGKSTFGVAIRYCLHGVLPDHYETLDSVISIGEDEMAVDVELSDGCFISRERKRGKWAKLKCIVPLENGAEFECNQDVAEQKIVELTGLDLENYDLCADIAQKKSDRFTTMKSTALTEVVNGWVGLDKLIDAEDIASKGLGALSLELQLLDTEIERWSWATSEEGSKRTNALYEAQREFEEMSKQSAENNKQVAAYEVWLKHFRRWVEADSIVEGIRDLESTIATTPGPAGAEIRKAEAAANAALTEERLINQEVNQLAQVARGSFGGSCPVLPGFDCPAKAEINAKRDESSTALTKKRAELAAKDKEETRLRSVESRLKREFDDAANQKRLLEKQRERLKDFQESVDYITEHGNPPDVAPSMIAVDSAPVSLATTALSEWKQIHSLLNERTYRRPNLAARVAAYRVGALALEQAQRRLSEGAVQRIEQGANKRLARAGIDLRIEWLWGRETNKLATRCGQCGAEFPASARVKQCQACQAVRGMRVEPKMHVRYSSRSGAAEDLAGVAITLSASRWVRERRGSDWGTIVLDEVFTSLDASHRRALSGHLNQLVSDGFEQAFVVAHSREVLESLPGRIEITGDGQWSSIRVVA